MPQIFNSAILVALGLAPSIIWLLFYLRKDCHPEPKHLLARTFLMGIIISPIAILLQLSFVQLGRIESLQYFFIFSQNSSSFYVWAALVEEFIKFYAVRLVILRNPEFDEPIDAMIYMITAALGFAAMENILVMFRLAPDGASATLGIWGLRFIGATFLHSLSSAIVGYFLAMSWFFQHHKGKLTIIGIILATIFHFTFNTLLSSSENRFVNLVYSMILLSIMAFFVSILFDKLRDRYSKKEVNPEIQQTYNS